MSSFTTWNIFVVATFFFAFVQQVLGESQIVESIWCGGTYKAPTTIESPYFPEPYRPFVTCEWGIESPDERSVIVEQHSYSLEGPSPETGRCDNDALTYSTDAYNMTVCGTNLLRTFDTESRSVRVYFRSNHAIQAGGFRIKFGLASDNSIIY